MKASIKEFDKIVLPEEKEDKETLLKMLKDKGIYEECSMICYPRFNSKVLNGDVDEDLKKMVEVIKDFKISLGKRKDLEED